MVTVPHEMVGLERMLDYRGVGLERFHCIGNFYVCMYICPISSPYEIRIRLISYFWHTVHGAPHNKTRRKP